MDFYAVLWRELVVLKRGFWKFFASRLVNPLLYLIAFGWGIGRSVQMPQGSYLEFVIPGIVALSAMTTSFGAAGTPLNMARLYHKTLEEYLIAPVSTFSFVLGRVLAATLRGLIAALIILGLALLFKTKLAVGGAFLLVLFLTCFLFSALGVVAAMTINSHEDMANFTTFIIMPMSFLCGTFFSTAKLPPGVRQLIEILPLTHTNLALRELGAHGSFPWLSLGVLIFYSVLFFFLACYTVRHCRD
ncbi:ABC transporter permease [Ammonifex thiophilus]|uniref:Transport permease protein n=1 Tax=Ammonifex thiophilus TaxID=444093 RepID=A0A3D8P4Z3_9THEO|nr:ABC transporter permease [Ammonifex thiophilus]RDV82451.1 multidrug ABC transporter permease [Ammonifex thiophilus]